MKHSTVIINNNLIVQKILIFYIPINITFDFIRVFVAGKNGQDIILVLRFVLVYGLFLLIWPYASTKLRAIRSIYVFILYILGILFFSSNIFYSLHVSTKIFSSLLAFVVSYTYFSNRVMFINFIRTLPLSYLILILNLIITNIFHLGGNLYTNEINLQTGGLNDNWNVITYLLLLAPLYFVYEAKKYKLLLFQFLYLILLVILLISFKRIAISGFLLGGLIFMLYSGSLRSFIKNLLLIFLVLYLSFPFYKGIVEAQYRARESRFQENALESEARYIETFAIWEDVLSFHDPIKSIFGLEAFNSIGKYAGGNFGKRQSHVDYNLIVLTNGLFGLILYLLIYYNIYKSKSEIVKVKSHEFIIISSVFYSIFFTSLYTSFAGQMYAITFRTIIFYSLGAFLKYLSIISNNPKFQINK